MYMNVYICNFTKIRNKMNLTKSITKNFTLKELLESNTAKVHKISEQYNPSSVVIDNLTKLTVNILQPLRDGLGIPITLNCAYRCARVNSLIPGSSATSDHLKGCAADIDLNDKELNKKVFFWIKNNCKFKQLINERDFSWVHVSYVEGSNRMQILKT